MSQSPDLKSFRTNQISSSKQSVYFGGISKSLTVSQSQSKALERYFYRRDSIAGNKIQPIQLKKIKVEKLGSFHQHPSRSAKNTFNTNGNQDQKQSQLTFQLTNLKEDGFIQSAQYKETESPNERLGKVYRRTSDWTLIYNRNSQTTNKSKKLQATNEIKLKINSKVKQKLPVTSHSNMQLILRKHKADNVKEIQQKMRSAASRGGIYDSQRIVSIKEYNRKCGYSEDSKIFIWNSEDQHIRKVLLSWGWIQNNVVESPFFHLKWTYTTHFNQTSIRQKQLINHFKNSQQMTSKSLLTKNLKQNQSSFGKIDKYYPKCYDIGNQTQWIYFMDQYRHNIMLILLKKVYQLFCSKKPKQMKNYDLFYEYHFNRDIYGGVNSMDLESSKKQKSMFRKKEFRLISMEDYKNRDAQFLVQINLITELLKYWRNFRKNKEQFQDKQYHFLDFNPIKFMENFTQLHKYALFDNLSQPKLQTNFTKQLYSTPSSIVLQRISKEYQFCKLTDNLFPSYGLNNLWIVKPTSNSRGSGIYLTTDLYDIQSSSKGIQSRLVQKYIEKPLLIKNKKWMPINMRKFDLRQWVLLRSVQPLQIYVFSECYLRLCHDKYVESQWGQLFRHLTNYSINKHKFKNKEESVLPLSYLKQVLLEQYNIDWNKTIKPQMQDIIIKSIKSCIDNFDDVNGNCFEMFGYDMLIDEQFKVWLLEINMSPACEERTSWLSDYLHDMATGMLKIILPQNMLPNNSQIYLRKYKWELILKEETAFKKKDVQQNLQAVGIGIKLDNEKIVDRYLIDDKMAYKIQRFFKKYIPKYKEYKQKKRQNQKCLNLYFKSFLEIKSYQQKLQSFQKQKIRNYFCSIYPFVKYREFKRQENKLVIDQYLRAIAQVNFYEAHLNLYKKKVVVSLGRSLAAKKQVQLFCGQIMVAHQKAVSIQSKICQFLQYRKQKKNFFNKYFKTLIQFKKFQQLTKNQAEQNAIEKIKIYLKPLQICKQTDQLILKSKQNKINQYIRSLIHRRSFYEKRLQIFFSLVGRVFRVSRRRSRCNHFKVILKNWKQQLERQKFRALERENKRLKQILQAVKQKQNSKPVQQDRISKPGSIRQNKKI